MNIYATTDCVISTQWAYNFIQLKTRCILHAVRSLKGHCAHSIIFRHMIVLAIQIKFHGYIPAIVARCPYNFNERTMKITQTKLYH